MGRIIEIRPSHPGELCWWCFGGDTVLFTFCPVMMERLDSHSICGSCLNRAMRDSDPPFSEEEIVESYEWWGHGD